MKIVILLLLLAMTAVCNLALCQGDGGIEDPPNIKVIGTAGGGPVPFALNATVFNTFTPGTEQSKKTLNIIKLSVYEETPYYIPADFTVNVQVKIEYGPDASSLSSYTQPFSVSYTKAEGVKYNAKNYFSFEGAEYVKVTIMSFSPTTAGSLNLSDILLLEDEIRVTRYFELNNNVAPLTFSGSSSVTNPIDAVPVSWSWPTNAGYNATQLEWTWLENELAPNYYIPFTTTVDVNKLFKDNATRVDLPFGKNAYNIPLFYDGAGALYYRIRAVNIKSSGSRSDGPWSTARTCSYEGHNNDLNWQARTRFAEEGKSKTVMEYYDGSLRNRQTVTKENVNNTTITSEAFYDYEGRPAIQILPVPGINTVIKYQANLNLFNTQGQNQDPADIFDLQPITSSSSLTEPLVSTLNNSGAAYYYSAANPEKSIGINKNIPDAEGYPYMVTRYTPDATGRIMAQSGIGFAMKMNSGHETKYYYGSPSQEELDGLFGTEVGNFTHYFKSMVKDANGQMSVSYTDMHGRTIATALAGEGPGNLDTLDIHNVNHYPGQGGTAITRNLLDNNSNVVKGNAIESVNSLLVPVKTVYDFRYELNPEILQLTSCTNTAICYDCMYNLEISITDESGDSPPMVKKFNNVSLAPDDNCTTPILSFKNDTTGIVSNIIQFSDTLLPGSYSIRKTLTISESSLQTYKDLYLTKGLCKTQQQLIDSVYNVMLSMSNCNNPAPVGCQDCLNNLGSYNTFRSNYLTTVGNPNPVPPVLEQEIQAAYNAGLLDCNRLCNNTSQLLSSKRQLMLSDMMPDSGQYARRFPDVITSMYNKYDIFSTADPLTQPFYKKPWNSSKQLDYYYNSFNVRDEIIHPAGAADQYALLNSTAGQQFSELFVYSWANSLLPHHPEYDRLVYAETNLTNSYNWISTFSNTPTYALAYTNGYIITSTPSNDPFYSVAPINYSNDMQGWITNNYQAGLSIWQIARGDVRCKGITDPTLRSNCYTNNNIKVPPFADVTSAPDQDQMWKVFRNLYAAARDNQVNDFIVATVPLSDDATLINQGYKLRFGTNSQTASQNGWTWYPAYPGANPNLPSTIPPDSVTQYYSSRCSSYIDQWKQSLLQCTVLANHPQKDQILNQITSGMVAVCIKGSNAANPYGSSNVAPSTPNDGSPRSFEEVVNNVFAQWGISRDYYCNPYVIEFPKPYGKGPKFSNDVVSVIDTCNCSRFAQLKAEASAAGYNPNLLSSLNQYFNFKYGDTLTQGLYDALQHCGELGYQLNCHTEYETIIYLCSQGPPLCGLARGANGSGLPKRPSPDSLLVNNKQLPGKVKITDSLPQGGVTAKPQCLPGYHWDSFQNQCVPDSDPTWCQIQCPYEVCDTIRNIYYPLAIPQPMPEFLKCGFTGGQRCLSCEDLSALTGEFKTQFISPYNTGPVFTGTNLSIDDITKNILYSRFINYRTGFQFGWLDYSQAAANAIPACNLANYAGNGGATQNVICRDTRPVNDTTGVFITDPPCQRVYTMAVALAQNIYQQRVEYLLANFEQLYRAKCMAAQNIEQFTVNYTNKEYHYTLYYFDMSGDLAKTVPPNGVRPRFNTSFTDSVKAARAASTFLPRPHELVTQYRYNSLNQPVTQNSPDANTSNFWYDKLGRLVVSQNAQQALDGKYSYTLYDELGRIIETGQKPQITVMTQTISQDPVALNSWIINGGGTREQITFTQYDLPYGPGLTPLLTQQNLRNRVSYTATKNLATDAMHYTASFYTYDIHGNVDTLLQDYKGVTEMDGTNNRFKMVTYKYDLISDKVNMVSYQPDKSDAFYHRYIYDAENRLLNVETSRDEIEWERDASYTYYKYGPLARTELGKLRVQGMDYAYTIQGWLKGMNSTGVGDGTYDIAKDGFIGGANDKVARDVYGFALHYYDETVNGNAYIDYKPIDIGNSNVFARPNNAAFKSLYNGNLGAMSVNNAGLLKGAPATTNALPLFYNYGYDQMNRIVSMNAYKGLNISNQWVPQSIDDYKEAITYDPNGNILTYKRKGSALPPSGGGTGGLLMDSLGYNYYLNTNRLKQVTDDPAYTGNYTEDIDNQANASNYTYDATGNLKTDVAEGVTNITWTVYGKIASLIKGGDMITYTYDAAGNRITKTANSKTTIYVRDASGNVMSIYEKPVAGAIQQTEMHLYGSSRVGLVTQRTVVSSTVTLDAGYGTATITTLTRNEKIFELSNHLGNVAVTISDKKIQYSSNGTTVSYYTADIVTANDYYPFGMMMPGRKYISATGLYRYGFNGKEQDKDINSVTAYDYGFRIYNPAIGRFLSVDPLCASYPFYTPYQFAGNKPTIFIDIDGAEEAIAPKEKFINVFLFPSKESMTSFSEHGNLAMLPGYGQVLKQNLAGNAIYPIVAGTPESAYSQLLDLKNKGYIINNIVIDSHGDNGNSFAIGSTKYDAAAAGTATILQDITCEMVGSIVLLGCEVGMNRELVSGLAKNTGHAVYADKAWSTDWPGMFNDKSTSKETITKIVTFLYDHSQKFRDKVADEHGFLGRLFNGRRGRIRNTVNEIYKDGISPSGTADIWANNYSPESPHPYWGAGTKRTLYENRLGVWVTSEGGGYNRVVPGALMFDKDGNIQWTAKSFSSTIWGQILQAITEMRFSTTLNPKPNE